MQCSDTRVTGPLAAALVVRSVGQREGSTMRRREFIVGLIGAAAWPPFAHTQPSSHAKVVGVLMTTPPDEVVVAVLHQTLRSLGWIEGRDLRLEFRFASSPVERIEERVEELIRLNPDVIFAFSGPVARVVKARTQTIPVVFMGGGDPLETGLVGNIARPEGNITGFANLYSTLGGKWLELLKEAAPQVNRVALLFNPNLGLTPSTLGATERASDQLGVKTVRMPIRGADEIASAIDRFAAEPNGGIVMIPPPAPMFNDAVRPLAIKHRLPVVTGGADPELGMLLSYSTDFRDLARGAASYVDRILRGAKVGDLPIQYPTAFKLTVNLKTAKTIGLSVPEPLLLRADSLIE
jgi:putative ABC transport system substrate-binding protein